jgi:hypothetical protein
LAGGQQQRVPPASHGATRAQRPRTNAHFVDVGLKPRDPLARARSGPYLWGMLRKGLLACVIVLGAAGAEAQVPVTTPKSAPTTAVPTYWVMMVTGETNGVPWMKTTTPETLGGSVKGTGPWTCSYPPTQRGSWEGTAYESNEVACSIGEQEVFMSLRCNYRTKARHGKVQGKGWVRSDLQTLNLRRKGDAKSTITVSIRCDVDAALTTD